MNRYYLTVHLHSDTTFGRGEGVAGLVDIDIEHDEHGFPFIGGRALKGLLREEWHNLRFALGDDAAHWKDAATFLFGRIGAMYEGAAAMYVGAATLPPSFIQQVRDERMLPSDVLQSLTTIRRQTAIDAVTGAPERGSLRAMRVLLRETPLIALLDFGQQPSKQALALLAACALAVRRGGSLRNRGRGRLSLLLHQQIPQDYYDAAFTQQQFEHFAKEVA